MLATDVYFVLKRLATLKRLPLTTKDLYELLFYLIPGVMVASRVRLQTRENHGVRYLV
jgi:hypothetical protein